MSVVGVKDLLAGARLKSGVAEIIGDGAQVEWAVIIAHTDDGTEVVLSADERNRPLDILRVSQEFNLALRGLMYEALREIGEANKEETP